MTIRSGAATGLILSILCNAGRAAQKVDQTPLGK